MQHCKTCGSKSPDFVSFCGHCGCPFNAATEGEGLTVISTPPSSLSFSKDVRITGQSWVWTSDQFQEVKTQQDQPLADEDEDTDKRPRLFPGVALLIASVGSSASGGVPMVEGTPSASGAPTIQGTPSMSGNPAAGQSQSTAPSTSAPSPSTATQGHSGHGGPQAASAAPVPSHQIGASSSHLAQGGTLPSHLPRIGTPQTPAGPSARSAPTMQGTPSSGGVPTAQGTSPMSGNPAAGQSLAHSSAPSATQGPSWHAGPQAPSAAPVPSHLAQGGTLPSHLPRIGTPQTPAGPSASSVPTIQGTPSASGVPSSLQHIPIAEQHLVHGPASSTSSALSVSTQPLRGRTGGSQQQATASPHSSAHVPSQQASTSPTDAQQAGTPSTQREQQALGQSRSGPVALPVGGPPTHPPRRRRRYTALIVLLLLLVLGILTYTAFATGLFSPGSSATVTITPTSKAVSNTFAIPVVTGNPDASQNQVGGAHLLSATTPSYTQTVDVTGQGTTAGTQASGLLYIENKDRVNPLTFNAGTVFPNQGSIPIHMQLDQTVSLPPYSSSIRNNSTRAAGHVVEVGTLGNVSYPAFQNSCSSNSNCGQPYELFSSGAFTGGTDPQNFTTVQQSDIDGAVKQLTTANDATIQQLLRQQIQGNEQLIGTPQCKPQGNSDHAVGDKATSVTITVVFTCTGEAYSQNGALPLAAQLLSNQAVSDLGSGYALVGNMATTVTYATVSDVQQGTITLTVVAQGVWAYQFSAAQQQAWAQTMAGKKQQEMQDFLLQQNGVANVTIHLTGGDGATFPRDPRQIRIIVQSVPGV